MRISSSPRGCWERIFLIRRALVAVSFFLSASFAVILVIVGGGDVIAQVLGSPLPFKLEVSEVMLASAIFLALPLVQLDRMDISIDLISAKVAGRIAVWRTLLSDAIVAVSLSVVASLMWRLALSSFEIEETAVGYWQFAVWPFKFLCAMGVSVGALVAVCNTVDTMRLAVGGQCE